MNTARKMAGKCMMLEKKLHELESELADVIRLPLDSTAAEQMPFDDMKERIEFLEKLCAAEAESHQLQDSAQLRSIHERLARLKTTFFNWNQSRNCGFNDIKDDTESVCSDCTQSHGLLRESDMPTRDRENVSGHKLSDKNPTETEAEAEAEAEAKTGVVEGRMWSKICKYCGVFGCGMIVGVMSMMVKLYLFDYLIPDEYFSIPPT